VLDWEQSFEQVSLNGSLARWLSTLLAVLALAACDLGGSSEREAVTTSGAPSAAPAPTLTEPRPTRTERVVQAIRACEVKSILIARDDTMWITYRGGRTVPMKRLNPWDIQRATERADACNILIGIE
jgi:hypothetical protein